MVPHSFAKVKYIAPASMVICSAEIKWLKELLKCHAWYQSFQTYEVLL